MFRCVGCSDVNLLLTLLSAVQLCGGFCMIRFSIETASSWDGTYPDYISVKSLLSLAHDQTYDITKFSIMSL